MNEAGQVVGYANRYNGGSAELGHSVWLFNGASTTEIGLSGIEHTRNDGYREALSSQLNEAGQVRGYSYRYNGSNVDMGLSAWLYNGATTINIGLVGIEHTRNDGFKYSHPDGMNELGQVRGTSY